MKKLVKLDQDFRLTEIDWKATQAQAELVREYIKNAPDAERIKYAYDENVLSLLDAVRDGTMEIPYLSQEPYNTRFIIDGNEPELTDSFANLFYRLKRMIGADSTLFSLSTHESGEWIPDKYTVEKDGELYEWCWFED